MPDEPTDAAQLAAIARYVGTLTDRADQDADRAILTDARALLTVLASMYVARSHPATRRTFARPRSRPLTRCTASLCTSA